MSLLTEQEWEVYSKLSEAWNAFIELEAYHPSDKLDMRSHIDAAKNIIMSRPVERELIQQTWPGYTAGGESESKVES